MPQDLVEGREIDVQAIEEKWRELYNTLPDVELT